MHELETMTEEELRDYRVGFPKTKEELDEIITALTNREQTYGTRVYAASISGVATMNFVASKLGMSGFQFSCADLDVLRRTRGMEMFSIMDHNDLLYPQYNLEQRLQDSMDKAKPWLKEKAQEFLAAEAAKTEYPAHPNVVAHWEKLANA